MNPLQPTAQSAYPHLRNCMAPQYAQADAEAIESYVDQRFGSGAAEHYEAYLEGFFNDLGRTFRRVAPVVANVAGGVARGALTGSKLGLPGIIGGALAGGAGTALGSYAKGPLRDVGNVLNTGVQVASQFSPLGRVGNQVGSTLSGLSQGRITPQRLLQQGGQLLASTGVAGRAGPAMAVLGGLLGQGGGGAAGQLSSLLARPEVQQALMALNLGPAGRRTVPVGSGQAPVPTTAIAGLLQNLSAQAVSEAAALADGAESELAYMADSDGEFVGDPAEEDDRAARVWDLLNQAQLERMATLAMQPQRREQPPRPRRAPAAAEDWRAAWTEDLLAGLGEFEPESDTEDFEWDGESDFESLDESDIDRAARADAEADLESVIEAWGDESDEAFLEAGHAYP